LDPLTGYPVEQPGVLNSETGEWEFGPVRDPAFYLWHKEEVSTHHVFVMALPQFTHREVLALERDVARFARPKDIMRMFHARDTERRAKLEAERKDFGVQKILANDEKIRSIMLGGDRDVRQGKSFSYPGQSSRSTPGEIAMDDKESGWELPEQR